LIPSVILSETAAAVGDHAPTLDRPVKTMRAEIETLVEEIKQSVGLLRRHL
jgi:hypothetical protein